MIAFAGWQRGNAGQQDELAVNCLPRWDMTTSCLSIQLTHNHLQDFEDAMAVMDWGDLGQCCAGGYPDSTALSLVALWHTFANVLGGLLMGFALIL